MLFFCANILISKLVIEKHEQIYGPIGYKKIHVTIHAHPIVYNHLCTIIRYYEFGNKIVDIVYVDRNNIFVFYI